MIYLLKKLARLEEPKKERQMLVLSSQNQKYPQHLS
jgi:hypothetical protein